MTQIVEALVKKRPASFVAVVMMYELFGRTDFCLVILTSNGLVTNYDNPASLVSLALFFGLQAVQIDLALNSFAIHEHVTATISVMRFMNGHPKITVLCLTTTIKNLVKEKASKANPKLKKLHSHSHSHPLHHDHR